MSEVIAKDVPVLISHLSGISDKLELVKNNVDSMHQLIGDASVSSKSEIDILNLKNQLLLSYILDLVHVVLLKCEGRGSGVAIDSNRACSLQRLLEIRTILEKMRPLEQRFSYQLDKLLRTVSAGAAGEHPLQFKPAPENLISKIESVRENSCRGDTVMTDEEIGGGKDNPGVYRPPRVVAMPYNEEKKDLCSLPKSQLGKTKLIQELRDEVTDFPTEIQSSDGGTRKGAAARQDKLKESYEEDNMVRLARKRPNRARGGQDVEDLMDFSLFQGLIGQQNFGKRKKGQAVRRKRTKVKTK